MEPLIGKDELAKLLGIPASTVDYLRRKGYPSYKVGKHNRYRTAEWLNCSKKSGRN